MLRYCNQVVSTPKKYAQDDRNPALKINVQNLRQSKRSQYSVATHHQNGDDQSEEADGAAEDLDDEDAHEERGVGRVGQRRARANLLYQ